MTTDSDPFTAVYRADDLAVTGFDAHARSVDSAPHTTCGSIVSNGLVSQLHVGRHAPWHRHAQYAAFHEPRPFARLVDRVLERHFVLAVQGLGNRAGYGCKRAQPVIAEVCAVGRIDAERG